MSGEKLLEINNLTVSFGDAQRPGEMVAVRDVFLSLAPGETLALVGESGCGKTVLCKSMMGLLCEKGRIRQGQVLLEGADLTTVSEQEMKKYRGGDIAMVFQDPAVSLDPAFSVGEQIAEALRLHKGFSRRKAKEKALELMELVQIPDAAQRYGQRPYQFSGGMRQRIVIAIALAGDPKILLADEPTTALDEKTQQEVLALMKDVQRKTGAAILFITHDLSLVEDMAQRVAIMKDGVIVEQGPVRDVFAAPQHPYTRKLLGYLDYKKGRGHHHRTAADGPPILAVKELCKSFPVAKGRKLPALQDFSVELYKGEILGLVGPSGCGKSTLARCIMGIETPDAGEIHLGSGGSDPLNVQMIFQDSQTAFNDRMTVEQIITEPLTIAQMLSGRMAGAGKGSAAGLLSAAEKKDALFSVMKSVELEPAEFAYRKPYELSGGQRQRVAIARALITEPELLIADEPLTGLDVSAQAQILHLLKNLADQRGLTILFIAHDLPMVNHISSRVVRMQG